MKNIIPPGEGGNYNHLFLGKWDRYKGRISCMSHMLRYINSSYMTQPSTTLQSRDLETREQGDLSNTSLQSSWTPGEKWTLGSNNETLIFPVLKFHSELSKLANLTGVAAKPGFESVQTMALFKSQPRAMFRGAFQRSSNDISKCSKIHFPPHQKLENWPIVH